jgi:hypothetical protein
LHDINESLAIFGIISPVTSKMNIDASSTQLPIQVSECEQVVSPQQHLHRPGLVRKGFDDIQLIEKAATRRYLADVLGFVDHHGYRATITNGLLYGVTIFRTDGSGRWHLNYAQFERTAGAGCVEPRWFPSSLSL